MMEMLPVIRTGYIVHDEDHCDEVKLRYIDFENVEPIYSYAGICNFDGTEFIIDVTESDLKNTILKTKKEDLFVMENKKQ